jgi:hypothetical protein
MNLLTGNLPMSAKVKQTEPMTGRNFFPSELK